MTYPGENTKSHSCVKDAKTTPLVYKIIPSQSVGYPKEFYVECNRCGSAKAIDFEIYYDHWEKECGFQIYCAMCGYEETYKMQFAPIQDK